MREIILHRRAARYLRRMPKDRQIQMRDALRAVAELADITGHPGVKPLGGDLSGWCRLRVGVYRALLQPRETAGTEVLFVDYIGPRSDAY